METADYMSGDSAQQARGILLRAMHVCLFCDDIHLRHHLFLHRREM